MTVWCSSTKSNTEPSEYFVPGCVTVSSIASLMAMPSEPVWSGFSASSFWPYCVSRTGAGHDLRAVGLHQDPPVRLLVVARADHVDLDLEAEHRAGERQRAAPLAGAGLRREARHALLLVVVGLRQAPCSACGCRTGCRPRTCSRCAPAYRAPSRADGRGRAATAGRACRPRGPGPGSRSRGPG